MKDQIKELAEHIKATGLPLTDSESETLADVLYMLNYRKRSEGEWKPHEEFNIILHTNIHLGYICSRCNKGADYNTNFCPHCGAKMKGENDGKAD